MNFCSSTLFAALFAAAIPAQDPDVKELSTPTGYGWYYGVTSATLDTATGNGYRITDIEVDDASPLRFNACLVRNSGEYASGWWWYYGLTAAQVDSYLDTHSARLIDLEAYDDGAGNLRFACVMVPNTGANAKTWWWHYGQTGAQIGTLLSTNNARPVDIDSYEIGGSTYYDVVMIRNTGDDYRAFSWYYNVPFATISTAHSNTGRRVYDIERHASGNGNYDAILIDDVQPVFSGWWTGLDAAGVSYRLGQYGMRPIDIESYVVNGNRYFAVLMINNSNALTTSTGQAMRATSDGQVGCYLNQINGPELAGLNEGTVFEPASTMKTLHHVHAMRRVMQGAIGLNTPLPVNTNYAPVGTSCPGDTGTIMEPLTTVLRDMMQNSDNARAQAVRAYFGEVNINATATQLGMTETQLRHRIGCGVEALANPNDITLYDLGRLHEQVANGFLGGLRDEFYEHMSNSLTWAGISTVIDDEAANLGVVGPAVVSFKALMFVASKGGSYGLADGSYRSGFGYVRVPFLAGHVLSAREFAVGAFVARATDGTAASTAVNEAIAAMLRPTLRAALQTWNVTAVAAAFGANCGGMNQTAGTVPTIGNSIDYHLTGGYANSLAVLAIGFSDDQALGLPLPQSLVPFGGLPGCFALCSLDGTEAVVANGLGQATVWMNFPASYGLLGTQFFTQFYSLGAALKSSRGIRNVIGA